MKLEEFCQKIELPEEVTKQLLSERKNCTQEDWLQYMVALRDVMENKTDDKELKTLKKMLAPDEHGIKMLMVMLEQAILTSTNFRMQSIDDAIYLDTMKCFSRFVREHYESFGFYGFDREWWTVRQLSLRLFRIGALEYELGADETHKFIFVHIPSDADLSKDVCEASIRAAKEFFKTHLPEYDGLPYECESWLLSPALRDVLPENSRILEFQRMFTVDKFEEDNRDFILWIFKNPELSLEQFPETTSLQKNVKKYMRQGKSIGAGYGHLNESK